jgi:dTDP-4-amino-4,6-dideoxy-D-galactose acyltransferase
MIEYLDWDSNFFNLKIGKAEIDACNIHAFEQVLEEKKEQQFDVVYVFATSVDPTTEAYIKNNKGILVDQKVTYIKDVKKTRSFHENITRYSGTLNKELLELTILSGHDSRFNKDPRLNPYFEDLYKIWISKSLIGEMADVVLTYCEADSIKGFVTVKKKNSQGQIGLIAVSHQMHGKGIGSKLIEAADFWYTQNNLETARVVTQLTNIPACKLYEKSGYSIEKVEFVYHL